MERLSKSEYGKVRLWGSIGFIGVAILLGELLETPYETLYYLIGVSLLTAIFGIFIVKYDSEREESLEDNRSFSIFSYPALWISIFLMQVSFGGFYNFFTIYELEQGIELNLVTAYGALGFYVKL